MITFLQKGTALNLFTRPLARLLPLVVLALPLALSPFASSARADDEPPHTVYLPLLATSGSAPDLIFTPDLVELAPGAQTNVQVRVEPQTDLRGATFELPGVQDGITSTFEAAADGTTGTLTLEASEASEADERPLTVHGTSGTGASTWVGALRITTTASLTTKTLFVDAKNGNDSADGSQSRPLKTIKKAFTKVVTGDTVKLLPGTTPRTLMASSTRSPCRQA